MEDGIHTGLIPSSYTSPWDTYLPTLLIYFGEGIVPYILVFFFFLVMVWSIMYASL